MSTENTKSYKAGGTITKYALLKFDTAGEVVVATDPAESTVIGVAQQAVNSGDYVQVLIYGKTRVIAGATITNFATIPQLSATTGGKVKVAVSTDFPVCRVLPNVNQVSAVDGDEIEVYFNGPFVLKA